MPFEKRKEVSVVLLKSLVLQGFKSFPDRTVLHFDRGTTVVVGPNGSGKSNISDAMKWVLGEISSKNLRGSRMEDVIFGGTDNRRQMGFAEVSVTFDNTGADGQRLASAYDEVTVTRRYYRSGDSEYLINKQVVRLRDVHELFMNTGIGREGYSIIGQGKIAEIISQKSEERRNIFEEAAGISKYRYKKQEAEKKLSAVGDNLLRAGDILKELEGRVGPLEKEAAKARQYLELFGEKKQTDVSLWLYDMAVLRAEIEEREKQLVLSKEEYGRAEELLTDLEGRSDHLYQLTLKGKQRIEEITAQASSLTEDSLKREAEIKVLENEIGHIDGTIAAHAEAKTGQQTRLAALQEDLEKTETALGDALRAWEELHAKTEQESAKTKEYDSSLDACYRLLAETADGIGAAEKAAHEWEVQLSVLKNSGETDSRRRREVEESRSRYEESIALLEERCRKAREVLDGYSEKRGELEKESASYREALDVLTQKKGEISTRQNALFLEYTSAKNRIEALSRMEDLFEGYARSVRFLMQGYEAGKLPGSAVLYGPVSRLVSVEARFATAVETALGANIQNIVTADEASAKAAIQYLKRHSAGRATFYPLTTLRPAPLNINLKELSDLPGYLGVADALVSCEEEYRVVVRSLLGRTLVADTIDHADRIAKQCDYKVRVVTLDGQVINAGGSFTGGSVRHDSGMLTRSMEIEKLRTSGEVLSKQMAACKEELGQKDEEGRKLQERLEDIKAKRGMLTTLIQAEETQLQVMEAQLDNDRGMLASLLGEAEKLTDAGMLHEEEMRQAESAWKQALESAEALREERAAAEEERDRLTAALSEAQKSENRLRIRLAEAGKDREQAEAAVRQKQDFISESENRSMQLTEETARLEEKRTALISLVEGYRAENAAASDTQRGLETEKARIREENMSIEQSYEEVRRRIKEESHTKELLFQRLTKEEAKHASSLGEREKKTAALWDSYELTYTTASQLAYPAVTAETHAAHVARQAELKQKIKALGSVNVGAVEEYAEVKQRYDFMCGQAEDLRLSQTELTSIIDRLEEEMRTRFTSVMEEINRNFRVVFRELFGGGHAELVLTEPDRVLESGIEICVAPPGKIIKNMMLLSGGEQSFVAIALYFSILKVNPSPFCILDEIEAALDEVNVDKFAEYLRKYSDKTQFIVISHRRGTMEIADRLYGVTMYEKGISTVLTVNANEVGSFMSEK